MPKKHKQHHGRPQSVSMAHDSPTNPDTPFKPDGKLRRKVYEKSLFDLHVELVKLQHWVKESGANSRI